MERIESSHSVWLFDAERMRFRRVPKGTDPESPAIASDWEQYFALEVDEDTGSFTVALNEERTRLLRSWQETPLPTPGADATAELSLEPVED